MNKAFFDRTRLLFSEEAINIIRDSHIAIFGVGGVGGAAAEAIARTGVGSITLVDKDVVEESNINRQMVADYNTIGEYKTRVAKSRIKGINPDCNVFTYNIFYLPDSSDEIVLSDFSYIIDAIDNVTGKMELIKRANKTNVPIISAMGAGNKLDPTKFEVDDIYNTSVCPLAKIIRKECKNANIDRLKVVYSKEKPILNENQGRTPGSVSFVPPVMGYILAGECIKDIAGI